MKIQIRLGWLTFALVLGVAIPASAWNKSGHMVAASLAYRDMKKNNPTKLAKWIAILKKHPEFSTYWLPVLNEVEASRRDEALFMLASRFPDDARDAPLKSKYHRRIWHFADTPLKLAGTPGGVPDTILVPKPQPGDVDDGFKNAIEALDHNNAILSDASATDAKKAVALCWILHLGGDVHQPLHTVSRFSDHFHDGDNGGNGTHIVLPPAHGSLNYHSFWDGLILRGPRRDQLVEVTSPGSDTESLIADAIEDATRRAAVLEARMDLTRANFPQLSKSKFSEWVAESFEIARKVAYLDGDLTGGEDSHDPFPMPVGFSKTAQAVAESQVALAGFRIGDVLSK